MQLANVFYLSPKNNKNTAESLINLHIQGVSFNICKIFTSPINLHKSL